MGSIGKSTNVLGSSGKGGKYMGSSSGTGYGSKSTSSFMGSSGKSDGLLGSSSKSKITASSSTSYNSGALGSNSKTGSFLGYSPKTDDVLGSSGKTKTPSSAEKSSLFSSTGKNTGFLGSPEKNKASAFSGKGSTDPNRDYPSFISPQNNKSQTRIGIIWIPTRKRNKKKDMVYNPHNYNQRYQEKGPSMYSYMSGDSPNYQQPHKKKEEETDLLVPERPKVTTVAVNTGITAACIDRPSDNASGNPEESQEFMKCDTEDGKEAAGDTNDRANKNNSDYLENKNNDSIQDNKWDKDKQGDKVDSVYLRPPPPHKTRSSASTNDEEDCGIKCLYYTLQCCDCVLM